MKKTRMLFLAMLLLSFVGIFAQNYCMTAPVGYGAATTGGGTPTSSNTVTVATRAALVSALSGSKSVILVSGTIDCNSAIIKAKVSNKTIIGLPGAKLVNTDQTKDGSGVMYLQSGSTNVILRNLIFEGPGAYDCDGWDCLCADGVTKLWVDHCDFQDGCDGNFDNKGLTDNVTISWCRFHYLKTPKAGGSGGTDDHRFTNLLGSSSSDKPSDGAYSITWMNCWWDSGCVERMVRCRNAELHFLNCYWNSSVANYYIGPESVKAYVEGCYFDGKPSSANVWKSYGGTNALAMVNSYGKNGLPSSSGTVSKPSYTYTALGYADAKTAVSSSCGAGATLTVAADGTVSTPCSSTPTLVLTSGSTAQSVTSGTAIGSIVYTFGGSATSATVTGLPTGVTSNISGSTITILGAPTVTGTFTYTASTVPAGVSLTGTITVAAAIPPTLTLTTGSASQTAYVGSAISSLVYTYGGGATGVTVSTNLPTGVTSVVNTTDKTVVISGIPTAAGSKTVSITTVGGSGSAVALTNVINVLTPTTLSTPTGISVTPSATSAKVTWTPVTGATGYTLYVCDVPTGTGDKILFHETFDKCTVGSVVYDNASSYVAVKNSATCTEAGTIELANAIIKFTGLNLTGLTNAKIKVKYKTKTIGSAAFKVNDEGGGSTNYIYKFVANTAYFTFDDVIQQDVTVTGSDFVAIRADSGSDIIIDEITIYIPSGGTPTSTCTEYPISGGTTSSYTITGLTSKTTYNYQLKAISTTPDYVDGAYSTQSSFTASSTATPVNATLSLTSASSTTAQSLTVSNAIAAITYSFTGASADVSWSGTENSTTAPSGITVTKTATGVTISGTPDEVKNYGYTVTAMGIDGGQSVSLLGTITVVAAPALATVGSVAETHTKTSVTLSWPAVANASGYVVNWCVPGGSSTVKNQWDFTGTWTLTAASADANLVADATTGRFNYSPATTNAQLVSAAGTVIPDTKGLLFTQTGVSGTTTLSYKLRLGYGTGMIYLNGTGIAVSIPCTAGDIITVVGPAGNNTAVNRGYTVTGGTLNTASSANVDATGIMNVAGAIGTWVYTATSNAVVITSAGGGMNIQKITVSNTPTSASCTEVPVTGTTYTATGLTEGETYTYQVQAVSGSSAYTDGAYTTEASVTTGGTVDFTAPKADVKLDIVQRGDMLTVDGLEVADLSIYTINGDKVLLATTQSVDISSLNKGFYIVAVKSKTGEVASKKFIKK